MNEPHTLAGAYALDAVDPHERDEFEHHLDDCTDCRHDVASFAATAARLPSTVALEPSPHLRASLLEAVATLRPLPPTADRSADSGALPIRGRHLAARRTPARPTRWFAAAAAAVLVAVGAGVALDQLGSTDEPTPLASDPDRVVERVLSAADAERTGVRVGEARATVVRSATWRRAALVTEDMPPAPEGSHYALWMLTPDGTMVPAGAMPPGSDQTVLLEGDATNATAVGVTVEPNTVQPTPSGNAPSSDPVVLIELG